MRVLSILFVAIILFGQSLFADIDGFNAKADAFFAMYVQDNAVNYDAASKSEALPELVGLIESLKYDELSDLEKQAFLINAYNILVIHSVSKNLPTESVMDINKFFDMEQNRVGGNKLSLNALEKKMLYRSFPNPLFHFVLVCGATDCPPIANYAYTADKLEEQLEERTRMAMNDPNFIRVTEEGTQISKIFEWYADDFGGSKRAVTEFINTYREEAIDSDFTYYEYDWSLNGADFDTGYISEESEERLAESPVELPVESTEEESNEVAVLKKK